MPETAVVRGAAARLGAALLGAAARLAVRFGRLAAFRAAVRRRGAARLARRLALRARAELRAFPVRPRDLRAAARGRLVLLRRDAERLRVLDPLPLERFAIGSPFCALAAASRFDQIRKNYEFIGAEGPYHTPVSFRA